MSVSASFAAAFTTLSRAIKILDQHDKWLNANSANFLGLKDIVIEGAEGDFKAEQALEVENMQALLVAPMNSSSILGFLSPFIDDVWLFTDGIEGTTAGRMREIRDYMVANSKTIEERTLTISGPAADGSNTGNNTIVVLEEDRHNKPLQNAITEGPKFECLQDSGNGSRRNHELFRYVGTAANKDDSKIDGSGLNVDINVNYDGENILRNPRFSSFNGTVPTAGTPTTSTATTSFTSWTLSDATKFAASVDNVTKVASSQTNQKALRFLDNANFNQKLFLGGFDFNPEIPYLAAALIHRATTADGTLTMAWGSKSQAYGVTSLTNNNYTWIIADRDQDLYYDNWKQDDPVFSFTLASTSTGVVQIVEAALYPGVLINGFWWWILGGNTPALREDFFTATIAQTADGINQRYLSQRSKISNSLGYSFTLPSASSPTEADA